MANFLKKLERTALCLCVFGRHGFRIIRDPMKIENEKYVHPKWICSWDLKKFKNHFFLRKYLDFQKIKFVSNWTFFEPFYYYPFGRAIHRLNTRIRLDVS